MIRKASAWGAMTQPEAVEVQLEVAATGPEVAEMQLAVAVIEPEVVEMLIVVAVIELGAVVMQLEVVEVVQTAPQEAEKEQQLQKFEELQLQQIPAAQYKALSLSRNDTCRWHPYAVASQSKDKYGIEHVTPHLEDSCSH